MAATTVTGATPSARTAARSADAADPAYQAFLLLRLGFTVAPIPFGSPFLR